MFGQATLERGLIENDWQIVLWDNFKTRFQNTPIDTCTPRVNQSTHISYLIFQYNTSLMLTVTKPVFNHLVIENIIWQTTRPIWKTLISSLLLFSCFLKEVNTLKLSEWNRHPLHHSFPRINPATLKLRQVKPILPICNTERFKNYFINRLSFNYKLARRN